MCARQRRGSCYWPEGSEPVLTTLRLFTAEAPQRCSVSTRIKVSAISQRARHAHTHTHALMQKHTQRVEDTSSAIIAVPQYSAAAAAGAAGGLIVKMERCPVEGDGEVEGGLWWEEGLAGGAQEQPGWK